MRKRIASKLKVSLRRKEGEKRGAIFYARKYWFVFFLIGILVMSLWFRLLPGRWNELIGLDEFHSYRIAEYALTHDLKVPDAQNLDMMRYSPYGVSTWDVDYVMPSYLPVFVYLFVSAIGISISFFEFAIILPAYMGAIGAIIAFFIVREIFKSNVSGLFAAFFVSMTPALFTRTSAASFEKEAVAVIFMMVAVWFFLKSYNKSSWFYGILSGIFLALMGLAWGGAQYIYLFGGVFLGVLFAANIMLVVLDYLFSGFGNALKRLEGFMGPAMIKAYVPMIVLGTLLPLLTPHGIGLNSLPTMVAYGAMAVLLIRYGVLRFGIVKKERSHLVIPALVLSAAVALLAGTIFTDYFDHLIGGFWSMINLSQGVVGSTVAENAPADWGTITSTMGTGFGSGMLPQLNPVAPFFALWIFMLLGIFILVYEFYRTQNWLYVFLLVWTFSTIFSVFSMVRLLFLLGPAAGIVAGFFFGWSAARIRGLGFMKKKGRGAPKIFTYLAVGVLIGLLVAVNLASTYAYSLSITTAICFPRYNSQNPLDVVPCVTVDGDGNEILNEDGQPWYQAMNFLSEQTPEGSVILSWWDFGYWFQTRGHRPSVADGGNLGGIYLRNYELADWYMDEPENWSAWEPWMKHHNVSYVFMDYTLPGKYGAISKIGSRGEQVLGFLEFRRNPQPVSSPLSNTTTFEYLSGPYAVWLTFDSSGGLAGTPVFLLTQNGKYYQKTYINEFCTASGIIQVANETDAMPGCLAINTYLGQEGLFYVPPEIEHTIFNDLMFMYGYGLPVEKVFDNGAMQVYKVNYGNETVAG